MTSGPSFFHSSALPRSRPVCLSGPRSIPAPSDGLSFLRGRAPWQQWTRLLSTTGAAGADGGAEGDSDGEGDPDFDSDDEDFDFDDDYEYDSDEDAELFKPKEVVPEMTAEELAELKRQLRERLDLEVAGLDEAVRQKRSKKLSMRGEKMLNWKYNVNHLQLNRWHNQQMNAATDYLKEMPSDVSANNLIADNSFVADRADSEEGAGSDNAVGPEEEQEQEQEQEPAEIGEKLDGQTELPNTWYDEKRLRRAAKLSLLKRRGKGPPKKGSGKRSGKK